MHTYLFPYQAFGRLLGKRMGWEKSHTQARLFEEVDWGRIHVEVFDERLFEMETIISGKT